MCTEACQYRDAMLESKGRGLALNLTDRDGRSVQAWYRGHDRLVTPPDNRPSFYSRGLADARMRLKELGYFPA